MAVTRDGVGGNRVFRVSGPNRMRQITGKGRGTEFFANPHTRKGKLVPVAGSNQSAPSRQRRGFTSGGPRTDDRDFIPRVRVRVPRVSRVRGTERRRDEGSMLQGAVARGGRSRRTRRAPITFRVRGTERKPDRRGMER